ncbi:MAG: adenylosuccinate lyase, partial [Candidatus Latescibacterota bacterium]
MIERYTLPEMGAIWSLERKFQLWLEIELLACEAWTKLRVIPEGALREIKRKAKIDVARIQQIEQQTRHDFIAFLTNLSENVGQEARFIHLGLTSYDVEDNALSLRMRQAADVLIDRLEKLGGSIRST